MLAELLGHPGVEEHLELRSPFGFLALHGGSLERMTAEVAAEAARRADASYYAVVLPEDLRWHVPSTAYDRRQSRRLDRFLTHVDVTVAVHGYGRAGHWTTLLLGGRNRALARHLRAHLAPRLPGYTLVDDLETIPRELRGAHPQNPVNGSAAQGVQLELPPRVRGIGPHWADHDGGDLTPHTQSLVDGLADAARAWERGPGSDPRVPQ